MGELAIAEPGVEVALPRAIGSGDELGREALRAAALRTAPRPSRLEAPVSSLKGAGPKLTAAAAEIGIETLGDLLWHLPHGHRDRAGIREVADLRIGEEATVMVSVRSARVRPTRRRNLKLVEAAVADASGPMKAVWFNQAYLAERLRPGTRLLLNGKLDRSGFRVATHEIVAGGAAGSSATGIHTTGIVPVHNATASLSANRLREWIWQAAERAGDAIESLPAELRARRGFGAEADALRCAHFPDSPEQATAARDRLAFEELCLHQAALAMRRGVRRDSRPGIAIDPPGDLVARWIGSLPFEPTAGQLRAFDEIDGDLATGRPMQRLLMGEVGSGKTVIAVYTMLRALEAGHQAALMAPTETLAEQHAATLNSLLGSNALGATPFALLTGATPAARRRETLARLATGELGLIVGTHALIEPDVRFAALAVCIVDEQHRFGVRQRAALDAKGPGESAPHVLHMTATPIPRTLSLTAYGDLDATTIRELPAGRRPIKTWVVGEEKRAGAYRFIRERLREGRQAYVVCPLVADSEKLQAKAADAEAKRLRAGELADFRIGLLHGQMSSPEKAAAMEEFVAGNTDVLVATTVIEVGIDVPNATVMLIEGAERFGLSQLHQLRGRVGRGEHESQCILFATLEGQFAKRRMEAIERSSDGFELAEVDLTLRGEGEILGTLQSGLPRYRVAELPEDAELLAAARAEVIAMLERYGSLDVPELGPLLEVARARFGDERVKGIAA
jgi:ATP-dependent DNA helicase RecG